MPDDIPVGPGAEDVVEFGGQGSGRGPTRGRSRRPVVVAGVAAVSLLGGAGVAWAAGGSGSSGAAPAAASSPAPSQSPSDHGPGDRHLRGFPGPWLGFGGFSGAVHGQVVVPKAGGGYETVDVQSGQVTAVSPTSITVKSADGYVHSYAVTSATTVAAERDGIGSVKTGNRVSLVATVSGSSATAASIIDVTLLGRGHRAFGLGPGAGGPGGWQRG